MNLPLSRKSGTLLDELEAYVLRYGKWPAAKGLELRQQVDEVERLAIGLCNSGNETEQNGYRRQLGILLCGWPE